MGCPPTEAMVRGWRQAGWGRRNYVPPALVRLSPCPDGAHPLDTLLRGWRWRGVAWRLQGPLTP